MNYLSMCVGACPDTKWPCQVWGWEEAGKGMSKQSQLNGLFDLFHTKA